MTQAIINEGQVGTFESININLTYKAWLGCDNKYFDRVCSDTACKGMYSSFQHATCPKCGKPLAFITTADGRPMGISEGTFYPVLTQKQKDKDAQRTMARKGGVRKVYRFKMFSFGKDNVLAPPPAHAFCKKGAMVEIRVINHQTDPAIFFGKDQIPQIEEMYHIFENYGDSVTLLSEPKVQDALISHNVDAQGNPVLNIPYQNANPATPAAPVTATPTPAAPATAEPTNDIAALTQVVAQMAQQLAALQAGTVATPAPQPAVPVAPQPVAPVTPQTVVTAGAEVDPFNSAA